jgi:hypothetical protein
MRPSTQSSTVAGALKSTQVSTLQVNAIQFGADLAITAIMCYFLARNRGTFRGCVCLAPCAARGLPDPRRIQHAVPCEAYRTPPLQ